MLDEVEVSIRCPKCGYTSGRSLWTLKRCSETSCGSCGEVITLEGTRTGYRIIEVERAKQRLKEVLERLRGGNHD